MLRRFFGSESDYTLLLLRLLLAVVIYPQGAQKLLGWYGGFGLDGTLQFFAGLGVPAAIALLVIASDFFGSVALALGLGGRLAAFGTLAVMLGAMLLVHGDYGFFINWYGTQQGEGAQFHLLAAASAVIMLKGSGAWSLDRAMAVRLGAANSNAPAPSAAARIARAA